MSERKEIRCYRCGKQVKDGGVGDFKLQSKYVSFAVMNAAPSFGRKIKEFTSLFKSKLQSLHSQIHNLPELIFILLTSFD
jgi:hypothetical protein